MRKKKGEGRRLGLKRSNGGENLYKSQTLKGGEEKIFRKMYKIFLLTRPQCTKVEITTLGRFVLSSWDPQVVVGLAGRHKVEVEAWL